MHQRIATGTPQDLLKAAGLGARLAVRKRRADGVDDDAIRREVIGRFRQEIGIQSFGIFADETLMATIQRAVEEVLSEAPALTI